MPSFYFTHRAENANIVPTTYGFAIIRMLMGMNYDEKFNDTWTNCNGVNRMIYQKPVLDPTHDVHDNASKLVEGVQNLQSWFGQFWKQYPIVLYALDPAMDIMWMRTWVDYLYDTGRILRDGDTKPLLFLTAKKWNSAVDSPDGEVFAQHILGRADLMISAYNVDKPTLPRFVPAIHWWEKESTGRGVFSEAPLPAYPYGYVAPEPPADEPGDPEQPGDPETPGGGTPSSGATELLVDLRVTGTIKFK